MGSLQRAKAARAPTFSLEPPRSPVAHRFPQGVSTLFVLYPFSGLGEIGLRPARRRPAPGARRFSVGCATCRDGGRARPPRRTL